MSESKYVVYSRKSVQYFAIDAPHKMCVFRNGWVCEGLAGSDIVLDYLGANQGITEDAEKVFDLAARRKDIKLVSSPAVTDILYVLRRVVKVILSSQK